MHTDVTFAFLQLIIFAQPDYSYLHMKKRMKEMMQRMLMMTAMPTKTVAALKAGERIVPKSSRRPRQISVPSWLKFNLVKLSTLYSPSVQKGLTIPTQFCDLLF